MCVLQLLGVVLHIEEDEAHVFALPMISPSFGLNFIDVICWLVFPISKVSGKFNRIYI